MARTLREHKKNLWDITEALMQILASISALTVKTDRLISDVEKKGDKIGKLRIRFAWVAGGATVVGTLIGIALTLISFARELSLQSWRYIEWRLERYV